MPVVRRGYRVALMRTFHCPVCGSAVFFDDDTCLTCGTVIGYRPDLDDVVALDGSGDAVRCLGHEPWACPWLLADGQGWCVSCRLDVAERRSLTHEERIVFERAKRRVIRQLLRARLDLHAVPQLRFEFADSRDGARVTIGHADGLVTLDLAEAHLPDVEQRREELGEPYRTPLGHVRHEIGHWHWQAWVATVPARLEQFRELFGDERADYADALAAHYARTDDGAWRDRFVTFYASAHPWEDYAESFAHVLHMLDTYETAVAHGVALGDPGYPFDVLYVHWLGLSVAMNELARSMGVSDPYPFAPPAGAVDKFRFVHTVLLDLDH